MSKKSKGFKITAAILVVILVGFAASLITVALYQRMNNKAAEIFLEAYTLIEEYEEYNIYSKQEMKDDIISRLDEVIIEYPLSSSARRALYYKGEVLYETMNYERAVRFFNQYLDKYKKDPLCDKVRYFVSYCYSELEENERAIETLLPFDDTYSSSYFAPLAYYRLGNLYENAEKDDKALDYYNKIVAMDIDSSQKRRARQRILNIENNLNLY